MAESLLTRMGLCNFSEKVAHLSGGQKKRVALCGALLKDADVLILDEPTNHLDAKMVLWLEEYLKKWKGALVMVTHDRYFLDRVTGKIAQLDKGKLYLYDCGYSGYLQLRAQREDMELATERKRRALYEKELAWIRRAPAPGAPKARGGLNGLRALRPKQDLRRKKMWRCLLAPPAGKADC